jgi:hypothetical protein
MPDLVIRLEREEAEALVTIALGSSEERHLARIRGRRKIRAALDSPPVEEREEFRVAGTERRTGCMWLGQARRLRPTNAHMAEVRERNRDVRIETRTITTVSDGSTLTGPWTDLPGEGGEDG